MIGLDVLLAMLCYLRAYVATTCVVCVPPRKCSETSMPWITASACTEWLLLQVHLGVTLGRHYFTRCETVSSSGCRLGFRPRVCMHVHTAYILLACAYISLPFQGQARIQGLGLHTAVALLLSKTIKTKTSISCWVGPRSSRPPQHM